MRRESRLRVISRDGYKAVSTRRRSWREANTYHGSSIIDTICTARRSTFFFSAVVIDSPSSGMKLASDCTNTGRAGGGGVPGGGGGGGGDPGGRCSDRTSPL